MAKKPTPKKAAAKAAPSTTRKTRSGWVRTIGSKATLGKRAT
tara:strand:+ start:4423 stop:4548 length:126 start_codon:yes stop_codon:yes gene_type:complete